MKRVLIAGFLLISSAPLHAQSQQPDAAKLKADTKKVVSIIKGDKAKTQTYCRILELNDELDQIDERKDRRKAEDLSQKITELGKTLGPEFVALADSIENMDPTSREGQEIASIIENLDNSCEH